MAYSTFSRVNSGPERTQSRRQPEYRNDNYDPRREYNNPRRDGDPRRTNDFNRDNGYPRDPRNQRGYQRDDDYLRGNNEPRYNRRDSPDAFPRYDRRNDRPNNFHRQPDNAGIDPRDKICRYCKSIGHNIDEWRKRQYNLSSGNQGNLPSLSRPANEARAGTSREPPRPIRAINEEIEGSADESTDLQS